jgi:hemerythrin-like domain-containing protein
MPRHFAPLRETLRLEHQRLERLFRDTLEIFDDGHDADVRQAWDDLERALRAHLALEEVHILPRFAAVDAAEAAALRREHEELRRGLDELGVGVELHAVPRTVAARFIATLRAHATREDALMYRWAEANLADGAMPMVA